MMIYAYWRRLPNGTTLHVVGSDAAVSRIGAVCGRKPLPGQAWRPPWEKGDVCRQCPDCHNKMAALFPGQYNA